MSSLMLMRELILGYAEELSERSHRKLVLDSARPSPPNSCFVTVLFPVRLPVSLTVRFTT